MMDRKNIKTSNDENMDFNFFLKQNMALIQQVIPFNPIISKDDEWTNDDYLEYERKETK